MWGGVGGEADNERYDWSPCITLTLLLLYILSCFQCCNAVSVSLPLAAAVYDSRISPSACQFHSSFKIYTARHYVALCPEFSLGLTRLFSVTNTVLGTRFETPVVHVLPSKTKKNISHFKSM